MQLAAWYVSLFGMALTAFVFYLVFKSSKKKSDYEPIQKKGYRIRTYLFWVVVAIIVAASALTLGHLPYSEPASASGAPQVVQVTASQFSWKLSTSTFKAGQPIEFDVTSTDVNHGFGIYDENNETLAETQAMPNYTNKLYYTFTKPGKYKILCLEYCGVAHHYMTADIEVTQ